MIIFFETGRLGNQLFQYCAIRRLRPRDNLFVAVGMNGLRDNFDGLVYCGSSRFSRIIERVLRKIVRELGEKRIDSLARQYRLISLVEEDHGRHWMVSVPEFTVKRGLIPGIVYFKAGYYQSEEILRPSIVGPISLKPRHTSKAKAYIASLGMDPKNIYFVHIRRGDYRVFPSPEKPAVLSFNWYERQIDRIRTMNSDALFLVFSDEPVDCVEYFSAFRNVIVVRGRLVEDLAVMSQCQGGGVLSASSFSWWAAYFVRRLNPDASFLAPLFWFGHPFGRWIPSRIKTDWMTYVEALN